MTGQTPGCQLGSWLSSPGWRGRYSRSELQACKKAASGITGGWWWREVHTHAAGQPVSKPPTSQCPLIGTTAQVVAHQLSRTAWHWYCRSKIPPLPISS